MYTQRSPNAILEALEQGASQFGSRINFNFAPLGRSWVGGARKLPASLKKEGNQLVLAIEVPGYTKDDVKIDILEGVLTVRVAKAKQDKPDGGSSEAEFVFNERGPQVEQERKFYLAKDLGTPVAEIKNGVVTLTFAIEEPQSQTIEVTGA